MPIDLAKLIRNDDVREALGHMCDLYFDDDDGEPLWCSIDGHTEVKTIARDGSGGRFVTVPTSPRLVLVDSEGAAGIVAANVEEFIILAVVCPYWRDLLHFSGGGRLDEMRRAQKVLEASWRDDGDNDMVRKLLRAEIRIGPAGDFVGALHRSVSTPLVTAHVEDGSAMGSLFGRHTIDDNV